MTTPTLVAMRGVSGSGKSTEAKRLQADRPGSVIVSRDDIRFALYGKYFGDPIDEDLVTVVEHNAIRAALRAGHDVLADSTHIQHRYLNTLASLAHSEGAEFAVYEVDTDIATALDRNAVRPEGRRVPDSVIARQAEGFRKKYRYKAQYVPITWDPEYANDLPNAIILDVDGTIAHNRSGRGWYDHSRVGEDDLNEALAHVVRAIANDAKILVVSGRDEVCRDINVDWFKRHDVPLDEIFMRAAGDQRSDTIVKSEIYRNFIEGNYNIIGVFDDRASVCRMWRSGGFPVYHVGDPYVEF